MSLDHRLIELLVCPLCKGPLKLARDAKGQPAALQCPVDRLGFVIRDGIPVMLESEAEHLAADVEVGAPVGPPDPDAVKPLSR